MCVLADSALVTEVVEFAESSVVNTEVATEQVDIVRPKQEAPQVSTCLADTDVAIGTPVTLEAVIKGESLHLALLVVRQRHCSHHQITVTQGYAL